MGTLLRLLLIVVLLGGFTLAIYWFVMHLAGGRRPRKPWVQAPIGAQGWSPDQPYLVASPSVIQLRAEQERCLQCESLLRADNNEVMDFRGTRLRRVPLNCKQCGWKGALHFELLSETTITKH